MDVLFLIYKKRNKNFPFHRCFFINDAIFFFIDNTFSDFFVE